MLSSCDSPSSPSSHFIPSHCPIPVLITHRNTRQPRGPLRAPPVLISPSVSVNQPPAKLKLALFNIRSLTEKSSSIHDIICEEELDIIFLTETWLGSDGAVLLAPSCPPNYSFSHSIREGKKGGGLASIFSDNFNFKPLTLGNFRSFEYQASILESKSSVPMINIYRPPKSSKALFLTEISELLSICSTKYDRTLIIGDINLHLDTVSNTVTMDFLQVLHSFDFSQHVVGPTHKHGHTLDVVISRGLNINMDRIIDKPELSDHCLVCFNMAVSGLEQNNNEVTLKKRFFSPSAANDFPHHFICASPFPAQSSVNEMVQNLNCKLETALNIVAPLKLKKKSNPRVTPWINEHVRSLKIECRRTERTWRKNKLTVHLESLKKSTVAYNKARRLAKQAYFSNIIRENKQNARVLFSTIDHILNPPQSYKQALPASVAKCNEFASFFNEKIVNIRVDIMNVGAAGSNLQSPSTANSAIFGNLDRPRGSLSSFSIVDEEVLRKTISQMTSSSCSLDTIPTHFLKKVLDTIIGDILKIVNSSIESGLFPDELKTAVVRPLLKKPNLDPAILGNYRPISNLPFMGKVLEKVIFHQLEVFLQINGIHNKFQSGFRKGHSTETALVKVINDLRMSADKKEVSVLLLLDLTAAFDTIDHLILIQRLEHWIGLSGTALSWFTSYLSDRSYFVNLAEFVSEKHVISSGIPQGSELYK